MNKVNKESRINKEKQRDNEIKTLRRIKMIVRTLRNEREKGI